MNPQRLFSCLLSVVVFVGAHALLSAQVASAAPLRAEVRFMSWEVEQTGLFVTENGRDYTPITAPAYDFGQPVFVRAASPVRVYAQMKTEAGVVYVAVGEGELPSGCATAQVHLIRMPDLQGRKDYRVIALSNDAEAFGVAKVRLFNFSPWLAAIRLNGTEFTLASLESRVVDAVPDRKHRVLLHAALQLPEGGWTPAVRDLVTLRENFRGSVTLLHTRRSLDATEPVLSQARLLIQTTAEQLQPEAISVRDNNR